MQFCIVIRPLNIHQAEQDKCFQNKDINTGEKALENHCCRFGFSDLKPTLQALTGCGCQRGLVEPPYTKASFSLAEPIFARVVEGPILVVHELELCSNLLKTVKADVVHLDMSLGGMSLKELSK